MVHLNWDKDSGPELLPAGTYLVEVQEASEKNSKASGDPYFELKLRAVDHGRLLCYDIAMLAGKGRGIGMGKLEALGIEPGTPELIAGDLIGKRAYAAVTEESYKGTPRLRVDINADTSICGYWPEDETPPSVNHGEPQEAAVAEEDDDDIPF